MSIQSEWLLLGRCMSSRNSMESNSCHKLLDLADSTFFVAIAGHMRWNNRFEVLCIHD